MTTEDKIAEPVTADTALRSDIKSALNRHSAENGSNTPDHVLADYLLGCLAAFDAAVQARASWFGRMDEIGQSGEGGRQPVMSADLPIGTREIPEWERRFMEDNREKFVPRDPNELPLRFADLAAPAGTGSPTPALDVEIDLLEDQDGAPYPEEVQEAHRYAVADLRAELSQVQKERDAARAEIERLRARIHEAVDEVQRRYAQMQSDHEGWQALKREAMSRHNAEMVAQGRPTGVGISSYGLATATAILGERDEARSALAALRAEVEAAFKQADLIIETFAAAAAWNGAGLYSAVRGLHARLRALVTDQSPRECSTCNGTRVVKCAAHIAGDGCEDLALRCPDCVTDQSPAAPPIELPWRSGELRRARDIGDVRRETHVWVGYGGEVRERIDRGNDGAGPQQLIAVHTPATARAKAYALLTAADEAEHGQSPTSDTQTDAQQSIMEPLPMTPTEAGEFLRAATECCGECGLGLCYVDAANGEQFTGRDTQTDRSGS